MQNKLKEFHNEPITFVETLKVKEGVLCDVYRYNDTNEKDLAIVTVASNACSPLQRVLKGDKTIIGFVSGEGVFKVTKPDGKNAEHIFKEKYAGVEVTIGDIMQWCAGAAGLVFYEIYYPPYADGRYEDL